MGATQSSAHALVDAGPSAVAMTAHEMKAAEKRRYGEGDNGDASFPEPTPKAARVSMSSSASSASAPASASSSLGQHSASRGGTLAAGLVTPSSAGSSALARADSTTGSTRSTSSGSGIWGNLKSSILSVVGLSSQKDVNVSITDYGNHPRSPVDAFIAGEAAAATSHGADPSAAAAGERYRDGEVVWAYTEYAEEGGVWWPAMAFETIEVRIAFASSK